MSYIENLEKQLFEMQDLKYRDFHRFSKSSVTSTELWGIFFILLLKEMKMQTLQHQTMNMYPPLFSIL